MLKNQKLNLIYNNKNISLKGEGQIILKDNEDQINYLINKNNKLIVETNYFKRCKFEEERFVTNFFQE